MTYVVSTADTNKENCLLLSRSSVSDSRKLRWDNEVQSLSGMLGEFDRLIEQGARGQVSSLSVRFIATSKSNPKGRALISAAIKLEGTKDATMTGLVGWKHHWYSLLGIGDAKRGITKGCQKLGIPHPFKEPTSSRSSTPSSTVSSDDLVRKVEAMERTLRDVSVRLESGSISSRGTTPSTHPRTEGSRGTTPSTRPSTEDGGSSRDISRRNTPARGLRAGSGKEVNDPNQAERNRLIAALANLEKKGPA